MARRQAVELSADEIISTLNRSALPTMVVEGVDDVIVYRAFEARLAHLGVSVFPAGGREKVLEVFRRAVELRRWASLVFIADQDVWIYKGIPEQYLNERLLFTNGYSIENDVFVDGELWRLPKGGEVTRLNEDIERFVYWYALALDRHLRDSTNSIALHPEHVLDPAQYETLTELVPEEVYPERLRASLLQDHRRLVRGKSLMSLLIMHTNYRGREARHQSAALLESVAVRPGALINALVEKVESLLSPGPLEVIADGEG
jgi:hypothetical protein